MTTHIHPTTIIAEGANIHESVKIGPFCTIGANVNIDEGCELISHVVIDGYTTIGKRNKIFPFASLGQVPQDLKYDGEPTELIIGNDNTIRESVTMNIGTVGGGGKTVVGNNNLFMALSHLGHDAIIANHCILANGATVAGHVELEDHVLLGGLSAVHQFVRIGQQVVVGGLTPVIRDVIPYGAVSGERATLSGLNLRGLRRRGFSKDTIRNLMGGYKTVFECEEGTIEDRIEQAIQEMPNSPEMQEWKLFIEASKRGLCIPK